MPSLTYLAVKMSVGKSSVNRDWLIVIVIQPKVCKYDLQKFVFTKGGEYIEQFA